ncbi:MULTISPECIES: helix-turn-helix domain-containing protein [unclassified Pseudovibrio]|uniref:helix-turn-helix domain-containing protein n=1 Tax=unclassified Pseudovibrio TaxID=2627060 RepID=UPI000709526E|nr:MULTISPECIES: helix-turn-helix transcriptional regulator [unclassified Pseudovibrio]
MKAKLTQVEMARALGCSQSCVSRVERDGFSEKTAVLERSYQLFMLEQLQLTDEENLPVAKS